MTKKFDHHFEEGELREGCSRCIDNVKSLLHSSSLLLDNNEGQQYALGLYVYAVEEFGKAILLKNYITGGKKKYDIPGWILGKGDPSIKSIETHSVLSVLLAGHLGIQREPCDTIPAHNAKLLVGSDYLPSECSPITFGIRELKPSPGKVIQLGLNRSVFKPDNLTGVFSDTTHVPFDPDNITLFDLKLKTSCFYMDFDKDSKTWKYDIVPDKDQLKKIIKLFEETLDNFSCN
jgi:hypothetical protein